HADDLALLGQAGHGLFQKLLLLLAGIGGAVGQNADRPAESRQHLLGVSNREEIGCRRVLGFNVPNVQLPHEPGRRHPGVIPHRRLSGNPSRSRGPGSSSRKKSASWASDDRNPFGTILIGWWSEVGVAGVAEAAPDRPDATAVEGGTTAVAERKPLPRASGPD